MAKEKEGKEKTGKTAPQMNLKEKRAAKAAKRQDKNKTSEIQ
ncbi:MAG: hypothetical protein PHV20_01710 [Bacteroidales bacterium]|nr:hypothetical protein [Bacteroidales bacterium]